MDAFMKEADELLKEIYWNTFTIQQDFVKRVGRADLSLSEMHILEVVGNSMMKNINEPKLPETICRISDIAEELNITSPSVTVAVNKLIKKDCVKKMRSEHDGRVVYVELTDLGMEIYNRYQKFHYRMIEQVAGSFNDAEKAVLVRGFARLNDFFKNKISQNSEKQAENKN